MKKVILAFLLVLVVVLFCLGISKEKSLIKREAVVEENYKNDLPVVEEEPKENNYKGEVVGKVYIPSTEFSTMVTQTTNNNYYLNHDINGKQDSKGNPFLDFRDSVEKSRVLRIYGHNSKTIKTDFHILENYYLEKYYQDHPYIYFDTNEGTRRFAIFSVYIEYKDWSYYNVDFTNKDVYKSELVKYKKNSMYETKENVSNEDTIIILQTCSYEKKYQNYKNKFLLVMGREV